MKFDQTYIAIRKRNFLEILDLSLHVIRDYFGQLSILWLIGVVPFAILNWFLIGWLTEDYYDYEMMSLYFYVMALLIVNQSQLATVFMTSFLGQAIFSQRPTVVAAIKSIFKTNPYLMWVHGFLRMVVPAIIIALFVNRDADDDSLSAAVAWLSIVVAVGAIVGCARPFATEILSLEKTPVFKKKSGPIHYGLRSSSLHKAANAELIGRFVMIAVLCVPFLITVLGTLLMIDSLLSLHANSEFLPAVFYGPVAGWIVAGIFAVARFLSYIDIRIRQEGWEVELRMRAEAIRLEKAT